MEALSKVSSSDVGKIELRKCGKGFVFPGSTEEEKKEHIDAANKALETAAKEIGSGDWDMVILDEINYAIKYGMIDGEAVADILRQRPKYLHVLLTGRDADPRLVDMADMVTEMGETKHHFQNGVQAQSGIES